MIYAYMYTYIYIYIRVYVYMCIYIHTHARAARENARAGECQPENSTGLLVGIVFWLVYSTDATCMLLNEKYTSVIASNDTDGLSLNCILHLCCL